MLALVHFMNLEVINATPPAASFPGLAVWNISWVPGAQFFKATLPCITFVSVSASRFSDFTCMRPKTSNCLSVDWTELTFNSAHWRNLTGGRLDGWPTFRRPSSLVDWNPAAEPDKGRRSERVAFGWGFPEFALESVWGLTVPVGSLLGIPGTVRGIKKY